MSNYGYMDGIGTMIISFAVIAFLLGAGVVGLVWGLVWWLS